MQIKKEKDKVQRNQKLEEENRDVHKELSGKDEEIFSLKRVNHELLVEIRSLKEREYKNQGNQNEVIKSNFKEELLHLRKLNHT